MVKDSDDAPGNGSSNTPDDSMLDEWQERLLRGEQPIEALAAVLSGNSRRRQGLFGRAGEEVLGYRLDYILGAGGSGVTYAATSVSGERVAVKLVLLHGSSSRVRFETECAIIEGFAHKSIVGYRAHGVLEPAVGALAMALVVGVDLEEILLEVDNGTQKHAATARLLEGIDGNSEQIRRSSTYRERVMALLADVADGLAAVHATGIVHRDVKPANIIVGEDLSPTLIDFGFARDGTLGSDLTMSGVAIGTLAYMAPEQVSKGVAPVGSYTDTYGLGLILYRALLGRLPHVDLEEIAAARRHVKVRRGDREHVSRSARTVLERSLRRAPERRYGDASVMADDLRAAVTGATLSIDRAGRAAGLRRTGWTVAVAAVTVWMIILLWPVSVEVRFVANCRDADAVVEIDGVGTVFLGQSVEMSPGRYSVRLEGDAVLSLDRDVVVASPAHGGVVQVPLLTQYVDQTSRSRVGSADAAIMHFMTGHSLLPVAPGAGRDRRIVDEVPVIDYGPYPEGALLAAGSHTITAHDGLGRTESQVIEVRDEPVDVQLLPAVMSDVDGAYRLTWSTVLSPVPDGLEIRSGGARWFGAAMDSTVAGAGLMALPCAFTISKAGATSEVELCARMPGPVRSAVVFLRAQRRGTADLVVEGSLGGDAWHPWPVDDSGNLAARMQLTHKSGADRVLVRAKMRSGLAVARARADVAFLYGVAFGGHWQDEPPCLAIVADTGGAAVLPLGDRADALLSSTAARVVASLELPPEEVGDSAGDIVVVRTPGGDSRVVLSSARKDDPNSGVLSELTWPSLEVLRTEPCSKSIGKPDGAESLPLPGTTGLCPIPSADGVTASILVVAASFPRAGLAYAGVVALADPETLAATWLAPEARPTGPFGDEAFGASVFSVRAPTIADAELDHGVLVLSPGYHDDAGRLVGKMTLLDIRDGREAWSLVGEQSAPVDAMHGTWSEAGQTWALVSTVARRTITATALVGQTLAFPLGDPSRRVVLDAGGAEVLATVCSAADVDGGWVISCTETLDNRLAVRRMALLDDRFGLTHEGATALPEQIAGRRDRRGGQIAACPDLDGDRRQDVVYLSGTRSENEQGVRAIVLLSSATLAPLAWHIFDSASLGSLESYAVVPGDNAIVLATIVEHSDRRAINLTTLRLR